MIRPHTWAMRRTTKKRAWFGVTRAEPSTAELRRWLRAKDTPRHVKGAIWAWLRYRRRYRS